MAIDTPPQHGNSEVSVAEDRKDFCVAYLSARRLSAIRYLCHLGEERTEEPSGMSSRARPQVAYIHFCSYLTVQSWPRTLMDA